MKIVKKIIKWYFSKFGYEIVKSASGLPSSGLLFSNFSNLALTFEFIFSRIFKVNFDKNSLRILLLSRLRGTPPAEAFFIIMALFETRNIIGEICEFGVAQGETSALIANEIQAGDKIFHIFDSFQGLSKPTHEDELKDDIFALGQISAYKGTMSFQKDWVISRLRAFWFPIHRYVLHEGFIEDVINASLNLPEKVSFAYLDFDLYSPIKAALNFLNNRTVIGSIIIIDDYDFFSTGVKKAVDEFVQNNTEYQIEIPDVDFGHFAILRK